MNLFQPQPSWPVRPRHYEPPLEGFGREREESKPSPRPSPRGPKGEGEGPRDSPSSWFLIPCSLRCTFAA